MILPATAARNGGRCPPCQRQRNALKETLDSSLPPRWDPQVDDLAISGLDGLDYAHRALPAGVVVDVLRRFAGSTATASLQEILDGVDDAGRLLVVEGQASLAEGLRLIRDQLWRFRRPFTFDARGPGTAVIGLGRRSASVKYVFGSDEGFDAVIARVNQLASPGAEYRRVRASLSSGDFEYAFLSASGWADLEARYPTLLEALFMPVTFSNRIQ